MVKRADNVVLITDFELKQNLFALHNPYKVKRCKITAIRARIRVFSTKIAATIRAKRNQTAEFLQ